jgi:hypothetical protein
MFVTAAVLFPQTTILEAAHATQLKAYMHPTTRIGEIFEAGKRMRLQVEKVSWSSWEGKELYDPANSKTALASLDGCAEYRRNHQRQCGRT